MDAALAESGGPIDRLAARATHAITGTRVVWTATLVAAIGWSSVAIVRESLFLETRYNTGNFTQAIWATAHGHFMRVTEIGGAEVSRLGVHVDPIIALLAPLWWLWPSPRLLLTAQDVALALGAVPLFWLGRKHLPRERDAALLAIAYLLSPTVDWNAATALSAIAFAVPLLLFAIWYLDEDRLLPFAVTAGAAMFCQEQIGLIVGCLGLWYGWRRRQLGVGLAVAATGFAVSAIDFEVVLRHFSGGSPYEARFGGTPSGIVRDLFTHPLRVASQINAHDLLGVLLAVPVLGFCFGSSIMLAAIPQLALLLLSRRSNDWSWFGANVLPLIPFIYAATVFTLARRAETGARKNRALVSSPVLASSLVVFITVGPVGVPRAGALFPIRAASAKQQAVNLIPASARVSATNHLAVPLAARRFLFVFPVLRDANWVILDVYDRSLPNMSYIHRRTGVDFDVNDLSWQPRLMRRELRILEHGPRWHLVYQRQSIYVFKRAQA